MRLHLCTRLLASNAYLSDVLAKTTYFLFLYFFVDLPRLCVYAAANLCPMTSNDLLDAGEQNLDLENISSDLRAQSASRTRVSQSHLHFSSSTCQHTLGDTTPQRSALGHVFANAVIVLSCYRFLLMDTS